MILTQSIVDSVRRGGSSWNRIAPEEACSVMMHGRLHGSALGETEELIRAAMMGYTDSVALVCYVLWARMLLPRQPVACTC